MLIVARLESDLLNYESSYIVGDVLKNKLGIKDVELLNEAERLITSFKLAKLYLDTGVQTFDVKHYKSIHKFLFDDIYPFAGEIRTENITKRVTFCLVQFIETELERTLKNALKKVPDIVDRDSLLRFITELYSDLDIIHPFREGNGRTEREFIRQFIDYICKTNGLEQYYLDYSMIKDSRAYIDAVVKADAFLDYSDLIVLFDSILVVKKDLNELNNDEVKKIGGK